LLTLSSQGGQVGQAVHSVQTERRVQDDSRSVTMAAVKKIVLKGMVSVGEL
jgi:hypothetical protein